MADPDRAEVALLASTLALVPSIYGAHLPTVAELRDSDPTDPTLVHAHAQAFILAAATVAALAYFGRSRLVLVVGGGLLAVQACGCELARRTPA